MWSKDCTTDRIHTSFKYLIQTFIFVLEHTVAFHLIMIYTDARINPSTPYPIYDLKRVTCERFLFTLVSDMWVVITSKMICTAHLQFRKRENGDWSQWMIGSFPNMLLSAVSRFYTLKFHSTSLSGAVTRGLCSLNFSLTRTFHNDPCCVGSTTKYRFTAHI